MRAHTGPNQVVMCASFYSRALFCCAVPTLLATVVSYHAAGVNFIPNNARAVYCYSPSAAATGAASRFCTKSNSGTRSGRARVPLSLQQSPRAGPVGSAGSLPSSPPICPQLFSTTMLRRRPRSSGDFELNVGGGADGDLDVGVIEEGGLYTQADLEAYSKPWGITLHYRGTLNTYRIEAHRANGEVAGYTTGFYLGDLLHLDKVQIQRKESAYEPGAPNAPAPGTRDLPWAAKTGNLFQLGAVLGCAAVRYGWDRGARRVELLAIRENDRQHSRLVRYYRIAGFQPVREVGEDLGSLRDRLTWGAEGTLMAVPAVDFMRRWTPLMLNTNAGGKELSSAQQQSDAAAV